MEQIGIIKNKIIPGNILKIEDKLFKELAFDPLIKLSILTIIAGYTKSNEIFLPCEKFPFIKKSLERFLSFILNDRNFAPIKFKIKLSNYTPHKTRDIIKKNRKLKHDYNTVILFSGGFDSSSALLHALDKGWHPLLLWVGFGQKNELVEEKVVKKLAKRFNRRLVIIKLKLGDYVKRGWKEWSYIVPGRNFMFAVLGAAVLAQSKYQINRVIMGVTSEEYYHSDPCVDKSPHFFRFSSKLFSKFYGKTIQLVSPLKSVSKTELVATWKNYWFKKYGIDPHETISCYFGTNCGVCNSCFKRSISFIAGGIGLDKDIKNNPFQGDRAFVNSYIKRCFNRVKHKTKLSKKRAIETLIAYKKSFDFLPSEAKKIINNLPPALKRELTKKEKRLNTFIYLGTKNY